jgi:RNA polymerase sigma factor (TIGR02999 family)
MPNGDVTRLLEAAETGDRLAFERLYRAVYDELHLIARASMRSEGRPSTLQPTALVNEAYLRLAPARGGWESRRHFFGAAAQAMRRILVDYARKRQSQKRGRGLERVTMSGVEAEGAAPDVDVLSIDEALTDLNAEHPRLAQLVTLRFFAGLSIEDAARALEVSPATAKRDWTFARAWLKEHIESSQDERDPK